MSLREGAIEAIRQGIRAKSNTGLSDSVTLAPITLDVVLEYLEARFSFGSYLGDVIVVLRSEDGK